MSKVTFKPVILKQLVLPILQTAVDVPVYVKFVEMIMSKEKIEKDSNGAEQKGEINIGHIIDLETGEEKHIVMGSVLLSTLTESYPSESYVGKCYQITKGAKRGGASRGYHPYLLAEIADPAEV